MDKKRENCGRWLIFAAFASVMLFLAYQTPYCHDEWKWGLPERLELMKKGFPNYNGRYLGDILAIVITRSIACKTLVMGGFSVWLLYELDRNLSRRAQKDGPRLFWLLLAAALLLALPRTLYAQSYGWPAAFVNFVPPAVLFLVYFNWTEALYEGGEPKASRPGLWAAALLSLATQLFCEHVTVFVLLYAGFMVLLGRIRRKRFVPLTLSYFAGAAAGAALMFSNGSYRRAAANPNGYKHIALSLSGMYRQFCENILEHLFLNNWLLNTLLAAVLIWVLIRKGKKTILESGMALVFSGYSVYSIWHRLCPEWVFVADAGRNRTVEVALSLLFAGCVLLCVWRNVEKESRESILILFLSIAASAAPLTVASPIGARCFYFSYVLECLALLKLLSGQLSGKRIDWHYPVLTVAFSVCVLGILYMRMFGVIGAVDRSRLTIIQEAERTGAKQIVLPVLPYSSYTWTTEPVNEEWMQYFKEFYHIPEEVQVEFADTGILQ